MKKPLIQNAFNTPGLFKPDMSSFKKSAAGAVGGAKRAKNAAGDAVPMMTKQTHTAQLKK